MRRSLLIIAIFGLPLVLGIYFGLQGYPQGQPHRQAVLADISLPDTNRQLRNAQEWLGKVVIVNHWATWCGPCREEIPLLIAYQRQMAQHGVQVIGIAHDRLDSVRRFEDETGINYPSLVAISGGAELLQAHGNIASGALPFTAVFSRSGDIARTHLGLVSIRHLDQMVTPLL